MGELLAESALLATVGAVVGVVLAVVAVRVFVANAPPELPRLAEIGIGVSTAGAAIGLTALTALLSGLAPAIVSARTDLSSVLRSAGRHASGSRAFGVATACLVVARWPSRWS
jgi:hypothetical protein